MRYLKIVGKLSNKTNRRVDSEVKQKANVKKAIEVFKSSYGANAKQVLQPPAKIDDVTENKIFRRKSGILVS